jgi:hypothetical protein
MPEEPKAVSKSVSLLPSLWEKVEAKAKADFGDNRSSYFRELAIADLEGGGVGRDSLVDLARRFHPGLADEIRALCYEADGTTLRFSQSKLLSRLIEATALALRAQVEAEKRLATAPRSAIEAELARLRQLEDAFFQIAATITSYPEARADDALQAAEPQGEFKVLKKPKGPSKARLRGAGPDVDVQQPA